MSKPDEPSGCTVLIGAVLLALLFTGIGVLSVYRASVQADVYRRQGIEMSTWEVLMGAHPAERTINIKEPAK